MTSVTQWCNLDKWYSTDSWYSKYTTWYESYTGSTTHVPSNYSTDWYSGSMTYSVSTIPKITWNPSLYWDPHEHAVVIILPFNVKVRITRVNNELLIEEMFSIPVKLTLQQLLTYLEHRVNEHFYRQVIDLMLRHGLITKEELVVELL